MKKTSSIDDVQEQQHHDKYIKYHTTNKISRYFLYVLLFNIQITLANNPLLVPPLTVDFSNNETKLKDKPKIHMVKKRRNNCIDINERKNISSAELLQTDNIKQTRTIKNKNCK